MPGQRTVLDLVPQFISALRAYVPGKPIEEVERELGVAAVKLASNENPLGPSPRALEAIRKVASDAHRYPDAGGFYLRRKLAARLGLPMENVVLGCGSTELIQLACRVFLLRGGTGLTSQFTFIMFPLSVQAVGGELREVPLRGDGYDLEALASALDEGVRVVYLANPNNPTGTLFSGAEFEAFLEKVPRDVLVILDEAYCDYEPREDYDRSVELVQNRENLLVLRTFSKIYGLAGLRIGYGLGHAEVVGAINRIRSPFNFSSLALAAAEAALDDGEFVRTSRECNRTGLEFLQAEFARLGFRVVPSHTNFLYLETDRPAREVHDYLLRQGVIVRPLDFMGMPRSLRVTVGSEAENRKTVEAFAGLLKTATA